MKKDTQKFKKNVEEAVREISVRVKPGSKKGPLVVPVPGGNLVVYAREPAVGGKANKAVIELLAKHFGVPKSNVQLISGQKSKLKRFKII